MSRNVVKPTKRWIVIHKISRMYKKNQLIFSYGNFFLSKGWPCFPITFAMPPFSLRCIRMQLSRWIDGNSVEVEDGWVSVEVNCHLTDGEENTARPKRSREVATAQLKEDLFGMQFSNTANRDGRHSRWAKCPALKSPTNDLKEENRVMIIKAKIGRGYL